MFLSFCQSRVLRVLFPLTLRLQRSCGHPWMMRPSLRFFETVFIASIKSCLGCVVMLTFGNPRRQVSRVLRQVKTSPVLVLHVMFPLDDALSTLSGLLSKFRNVHHVKELVRHQLIAGV